MTVMGVERPPPVCSEGNSLGCLGAGGGGVYHSDSSSWLKRSKVGAAHAVLLDVKVRMSPWEEVLVVRLVTLEETVEGVACGAKAWAARHRHRANVPRTSKLQRADFMAAIAGQGSKGEERLCALMTVKGTRRVSQAALMDFHQTAMPKRREQSERRCIAANDHALFNAHVRLTVGLAKRVLEGTGHGRQEEDLL